MQVYANDLNPKSHQYLEENIKLNKVIEYSTSQDQRFQFTFACSKMTFLYQLRILSQLRIRF